MSKGKLEKFADIGEMPNVFQDGTPIPVKPVGFEKGWYQGYFKNDHPIVLELACGKGDYTIALAEKYPDKNFIGVDIKGNRIWTGAKAALDKKLYNVLFLRTYIDKLPQFFEKNTVSEIWITFPDPYLKKSKSSKRLTSPPFLARYKQVLKPEGLVQLKTDSPELFEFTKEVLTEKDIQPVSLINDVYEEDHGDERLFIQTYYEKMHLEKGRIIRFISFRL